MRIVLALAIFGFCTTASYAQQSINSVPTIPSNCGTIPTAETLNGTAGSGSCFQTSSANSPTILQAVNAATDASGNWTVTWGRAFVSATPIIHAKAIVASGTQPITCEAVTRSATTVTGWCRQAAIVAVAILGVNVNVFSAAPTTGTAVMITGREPTQ